MAKQRKLTTILATDVAGYSRLMARDEESTLASLGACRKVLDALVTDNGGRIFGSAGDSFVAEFSSPVAAVRCAVAFQSEMAQRNKALPECQRLTFRAGVNIGDVLVDEDNLYGDGVNTAVRLETVADPGGLVVSRETYNLVRNKVPVRFEDLGDKALKNLPEPVRVFRVIPKEESGAPAAVVAVTVPSASRERSSIVVLPFENLGRDPEQDYFCDGLTQDVTTDLSRFRDLFVIAANSAFTYKGLHKKAQDIAAELGVRYLLEGSVRRTADRLRINVQLIDATTGHHVWAERYDRKRDDVWEIADSTVRRIVGTIAPQLALAERRRAAERDTSSAHAYDAFLRGTYEFARHFADEAGSEDRLAVARDWFRRAIDADATYARAWGWLASCLVHSWSEGWLSDEALTTAEDAARRAVALAPDDYDTHWALATTHAAFGKLNLARQEFDTAVALNANDADLLADFGDTLTYFGETAKAIELIAQAMTINPRYPDWYSWHLGWAFHVAGRYAESNVELGRIARPGHQIWAIVAANHARLAAGCRGDGALAEAEEHAGTAMEALRCVRAMRPDWTLTKEAALHSFRRGEDRDHWLEGLRLAGLPE